MSTLRQAGSQHLKDVILLLMAAVGWSFGGVLIKQVEASPIALAGARSAIAAVVLWIYLKRPKIIWSRSQIGGAFVYAATVITFVAATKMTTAANAILLQYTAPIYVALLGAWFLGEKTKLRDWFTIFFVIAGMVLFFLDDFGPGSFWGNIIAILSGICYAVFVVILRKQKDGSPAITVFLGNIATAIISLPFIFQISPSTKNCFFIVVLGVAQLGIPYILYTIAIKNVKALESVLVSIIEPILNPIWVFLFMGEVPGKWAIIGGLIVILSVTIRYTWKSVSKPYNFITEVKQ